MIYLTGDTHGDPIHRLSVHNFPEQKELSPYEDNYVIVLGDFGVVWDGEPSKEERYRLKWLDEKPWTTLFVDGNHENHDRLDAMETEMWMGGRVHRLSDKVIHLMRGEVYDICGIRFFAFGGASSHDIDNLLDPKDPCFKRKRKKIRREQGFYRVIGKSWWVREQANQQEKEHAIENLDKIDWKCDVVLSHTPPALICDIYSQGEFTADDTSSFLDDIRKKLEYGKWFSGHLHANATISEKHHILYGRIEELNI